MISTQDLNKLSIDSGISQAMIHAIIDVEGSGVGFNPPTGKIIIRFEPSWFKRLNTDWKLDTAHLTWQNTGNGNQANQWAAFNNAFAEDPEAAMKSTSIGIMQVMGFHYSELGFKNVGEMWDFAKINEYNQVVLALRFIKTNSKLYQAAKDHNFKIFAYYYNGSAYSINKYDVKLETAYKKYI